jgi:hypothetical protein
MRTNKVCAAVTMAQCLMEDGVVGLLTLRNQKRLVAAAHHSSTQCKHFAPRAPALPGDDGCPVPQPHIAYTWGACKQSIHV